MKHYTNDDLHPEHLQVNDAILEAVRQGACAQAEEQEKEIRALQLYCLAEGFNFSYKKK